MSRSYRHSPRMGVAGTRRTSEKLDKQTWHRKFRRRNKEVCRTQGEPKHFREVSDVWGFNKDGKMWFDPLKYPKYMRK